jgi:hypothetical protein
MRRDLAIIVFVALAALFAYGRAGQPIHSDRGYHVYMAQTVLRGDALYGETTYGYTPYAPLITAGAMRLLGVFGVPSYLAPRYLGGALVVLLAVLLYLVARRVSDARTALIAAVTLCGFAYLALLSAVGTEPVVLVAVFMLLAILSLQREWWFGAGFAASAAACTWQPAIVICLAVFVLARRRLPVIAGVFVAALPALVYIAPRWEDFVYQAILRKASAAKVTLGLAWLVNGARTYWTDVLVLLAAAIGFTLALVHRRDEERPLFAMTFAWVAWFVIYFWTTKDLMPALPLIAYWAARLMSRRSLAVLVLYLAFLFADAALYRPTYTLSQQIRDVHGALGEHRASFIAFGAEEFYVLTESRAPVRYIRLGDWIDDFIDARDGGVTAFVDRIARLDPPVIVIADDEGPSRVRTALEPILRDRARFVVPTAFSYPDTRLVPTELEPAIVYRRR